MTTFKVGDRVRFEDDDKVAIITGPDSDGQYDWFHEYEDGAQGLAYESELTLVESAPRFVNTTEVRIVWITLPGADRSYALSQEQAYALFRQLEEVV